MNSDRKEKKKMFLISASVFFIIIIFTLILSLNAIAVGTPSVTITMQQGSTLCVVINATYNDTVSVPASVGCGGLSCATDPACCNPKDSPPGN